MLRNILITGCLSIFLAVLAGSASSRAEDIISSKETADAVWNTSNQEAQTLSELNKQVKTKLESNTNDFGKFLIQQETDRKIKEASVPRSTYMLSVLFSALPTTQFTFEQVRTTLHNIVFEAMEGRPIVANADSTSTGPATDINAFAKSTPIAIDAMLVKKFDSLFCIKESVSATPACKASGASQPAFNIIDFFVSDKTWANATVMDVLTLMRRFMAGSAGKMVLGGGIEDAGTFVNRQGSYARTELRMAILNDLASHRAPASTATGEVLASLLRILTPSGQISTLNYLSLCKGGPATRNQLESYACSFTSSTIGEKGERMLSQAAMDRIMQHDYYLSSDFYTEVNGTDHMATGPIERMDVTIRAQQLSQDYRILQLLKMKTLATALRLANHS